MINDLQLDMLAAIASYNMTGCFPTRQILTDKMNHVRGKKLAYSTVNTTLQRLVALKAIKMAYDGPRTIYYLDDPDLMLARDYSTLYRTTELVRQWKEMTNGTEPTTDSGSVG